MISQGHAVGSLLGLACGDALGRPVEFQSSAEIEAKHGQLRKMIGNGTHNQSAGTVTDDTEMALCIARSLVKRDEFDPADIAQRFLQWYQSDPFDIGMMTADALRQIKKGMAWEEAGQWVYDRRPEGQNAGNGSVMRCAPLALAYGDNLERLQQVSRDSSRITHADPRCMHGCAVLNCTIAGYLQGVDAPLPAAIDQLPPEAPEELLEALTDLQNIVTVDSLENTGYVIHTLQTSLYHALTANSFEDAIIRAVNMGGDTDTLGAVTGAVAGTRFGADEIPDRWLSTLDYASELREIAEKLTQSDFNL